MIGKSIIVVALTICALNSNALVGDLDVSFSEEGKYVDKRGSERRAESDPDMFSGTMASDFEGNVVALVNDAMYKFLPSGNLDQNFSDNGVKWIDRYYKDSRALSLIGDNIIFMQGNRVVILDERGEVKNSYHLKDHQNYNTSVFNSYRLRAESGHFYFRTSESIFAEKRHAVYLSDGDVVLVHENKDTIFFNRYNIDGTLKSGYLPIAKNFSEDVLVAGVTSDKEGNIYALAESRYGTGFYVVKINSNGQLDRDFFDGEFYTKEIGTPIIDRYYNYMEKASGIYSTPEGIKVHSVSLASTRGYQEYSYTERFSHNTILFSDDISAFKSNHRLSIPQYNKDWDILSTHYLLGLYGTENQYVLFRDRDVKDDKNIMGFKICNVDSWFCIDEVRKKRTVLLMDAVVSADQGIIAAISKYDGGSEDDYYDQVIDLIALDREGNLRQDFGLYGISPIDEKYKNAKDVIIKKLGGELYLLLLFNDRYVVLKYLNSGELDESFANSGSLEIDTSKEKFYIADFIVESGRIWVIGYTSWSESVSKCIVYKFDLFGRPYLPFHDDGVYIKDECTLNSAVANKEEVLINAVGRSNGSIYSINDKRSLLIDSDIITGKENVGVIKIIDVGKGLFVYYTYRDLNEDVSVREMIKLNDGLIVNQQYGEGGRIKITGSMDYYSIAESGDIGIKSGSTITLIDAHGHISSHNQRDLMRKTGYKGNLIESQAGIEMLSNGYFYLTTQTIFPDSSIIARFSGRYKDSDLDLVFDMNDAFAEDFSASVDDDNDGLPDFWHLFCDEGCQKKTSLILDTSLQDSDNDGIQNEFDVFPLDPLEYQDTDGDGVGDNSDPYPNDDQNRAQEVDGPVAAPPEEPESKAPSEENERSKEDASSGAGALFNMLIILLFIGYFSRRNITV